MYMYMYELMYVCVYMYPQYAYPSSIFEAVNGTVPIAVFFYVSKGVSRDLLKSCSGPIPKQYSETSLKRPPKGPANSGRYR